MNTKTNFIMFSGPSGVGKSIYMHQARKELEKHGYTVESHRRTIDTSKPDWKGRSGSGGSIQRLNGKSRR
jgi:ribose 1,5-bisphosphokinase PhnN